MPIRTSNLGFHPETSTNTESARDEANTLDDASKEGMTSTDAITAGPAEAVQNFHPRFAHRHASMGLVALPRSLTPPPPQHLPK